MIRLLTTADGQQAAALYKFLMPDIAEPAQFASLVEHTGTLVAGADVNAQIVSIATLHLLPNMTQGGRPYGLIENVVTHPDFRGQGWMRRVMKDLHTRAWDADAYKIMLLTGQDTGARGFYEKLGYLADQKYGMQIRRVPPRDGMVGGVS